MLSTIVFFKYVYIDCNLKSSDSKTKYNSSFFDICSVILFNFYFNKFNIILYVNYCTRSHSLNNLSNFESVL